MVILIFFFFFFIYRYISKFPHLEIVVLVNDFFMYLCKYIMEIKIIYISTETLGSILTLLVGYDLLYITRQSLK